MVYFARKLDTILKYYELSRFAFSKKIGVDPTSITSYMEKGAVPTFRTINSILENFPMISAEWLLRDSGDMLLDGTTPVLPPTISDARKSDPEDKFKIAELQTEVHKLSIKNESLTVENTFMKRELDETKAKYDRILDAYISVTMKK